MNVTKHLPILLLTISTFSIKSHAIIGDYIDPSYHPKQTCKLTINKNTRCTGTLIEKNVILTANHCLDDQYKKVDVVAKCDDQVAKGMKVELLGESNDLAKLTLDRSLNIEPMQIANDQIINQIKQNTTGKYFCAFFGYGLDNNMSTKHLHGILSNESSITIEKSFENQLNLEPEFQKILQNNLNNEYQPYADLAKINLKILNEPIMTSEITLTNLFNDLRFKAKITDEDTNNFNYSIAYKIQMKIEELKREFLNTPAKHFPYIKSTSSNSLAMGRGVSGIDGGDSGGTFACKVVAPNALYLASETKWVLVGVTSYKTSHTFMQTKGNIILESMPNEINYNGFASLLDKKNQSLLKIKPQQVTSLTKLSNRKIEKQLTDDMEQDILKYGTKIDNISAR